MLSEAAIDKHGLRVGRGRWGGWGGWGGCRGWGTKPPLVTQRCVAQVSAIDTGKRQSPHLPTPSHTLFTHTHTHSPRTLSLLPGGTRQGRCRRFLAGTP